MFLQYAWGMKTLSMELARDWDGATVILSPRDITPDQLKNWKKDFAKAGINSLFDPQCYFPKSDHKRLSQYDYWDNKYNTKLSENSAFQDSLIKTILNYNDDIGASEFIIPANMGKFGDDWLNDWHIKNLKLIEATKKHVINKKIILTIALPDLFLTQKEDAIEELILKTEKYDVDGYYIVALAPEEKYLVDVPIWLVNLLQLCAGLRLQGKKVIMGYGNHQLICLSTAGVNSMATGTFLNVRRFTNKFVEQEGIKQRSKWYYYPQALSEYKIGFLDVAYSAGIISEMKPPKNKEDKYSNILFGEVAPSNVNFSERMSFKHYLNSVRVQLNQVTRGTFEKTVSANEVLLETAQRRIEDLEKHGVYAQTRSFKEIVDVNRSAIQRLQKNYGYQLGKEWSKLIRK